jgi:hypothetical protein
MHASEIRIRRFFGVKYIMISVVCVVIMCCIVSMTSLLVVMEGCRIFCIVAFENYIDSLKT